MFEARLNDAEVLRKIIDAMKDLVSEANLDVSPEGVSLQNAFDSYRCDKKISLGLNLQNLTKILKCAKKGDSVSLKAEDEGDSISITFDSEDDGRVSEFEMKLMDIDSEHLGIPETEYKVVVVMPSGEYSGIIRDMATIGETCSIQVKKGTIAFGVEGDLGTGSVELAERAPPADKPDAAAVEISMEEAVDLSFAVSYLQHFSKGSGLSSTVSLSMSPGVPLVVEYPLNETSFVRYYLAPKIDDEEE